MRAAVVIGVDKVGGGLARLHGAASGAIEVADWLRRSDYEVSLFTDKDGEVTRSDIFAAVTGLVQRGTVQQLVIYFAGHGFLKGPLDEYWLLSRAPLDPSEAVNLTYCAAVARYRGIPQIIFVSDACRVVPQTNVHSAITGGPIMPNVELTRRSAEIDYYYATLPGDPAHERTASEAHDAHGLFTKELLDAHKSAPLDALLQSGSRYYVRNTWLKAVLEDKVTARAESISLRLTQLPDIQIQIQDGYIARSESPLRSAPGDKSNIYNHKPPQDLLFEMVDMPGAPRRASPNRESRSARTARRGMARTGSRRNDPATAPAPPLVDLIVKPSVRAGKPFQDRLQLLLRAEQILGQTHQEIVGPSLICVGDEFAVLAGGAGIAVNKPARRGLPWQFRLTGNASQVAVQFSDGSGMLLPVLREYACEVIRDEGRTLSVNYTWLPYREPQLAELRAEVLSAATLGLLVPNGESTRALAEKLRHAKRFDPILGLVAALAYTLGGDARGASSVRDYMRRDLHADLFDSWLLGGAGDGPPIVPSMPLLAQSWTFLDVFGIAFPDALKRLPRVPGFWTVFEAAAMDTIKRTVADWPKGFEPND